MDEEKTHPPQTLPGRVPGEQDRSTIPRAGFLQRVGGLGVFAAVGGAAAALRTLLDPLSAMASSARARMAASGPGVLLGNVRTMRRNSALAYIDPASGDPALLLHLADGRFVSFDTVCTHAGCTVPYDPTKRLLICPCHGATFDPARGARVLRGPARQPLTALPIRLDAHGNAYALDAKPGSGRSTGGLHAAPRPGAGGDDRGGEGDDGNGRSGHGDD